jgi:hypothetical protein
VSTPGPVAQADRQTFPGLMPQEVAVLREWLRIHESEYDSFDYNVRCGVGSDPGPTYDAKMRQMSLDITRKRIDAVAIKGSDVTLIEVKKRATLSAVGQIVAYRTLWNADNPLRPASRLLLVASAFDPDVMPVLAANAVDYAIVAFNPLLIPQRSFPPKGA